MNHTVHISFGFHVNLYHSFRGDTNDESGFGKDIRIIRKTINILDEFNKMNIKVKGTWDFENAYSLEKMLPYYAPDILENIVRRIRQNGDEIHIMSYNNGLASCMDGSEFESSIELAVSNSHKSGVMDIFGCYAPVVRPQEMMFSPTDIYLYRKMGIEAICLYYSGVPFDSFRTLIPLLPEEHAFNPLFYEYGNEKIKIIPAVSHSDLLDYGSLGMLAGRLHKKQKSGEFNNDVLIYLNMDADAELWDGIKLPILPGGIPNASGLGGMLREVCGLDYVVFNTPWNYLKDHPPLQTISFSQDIADGSFDGYANWAERPINHLLWTRVEKARFVYNKVFRLLKETGDPALGLEAGRLLEESYNERIKLLSTTHFGLSAPVINKDREAAALTLSKNMLEKANKALNLVINEHPAKTSQQALYKVDIRHAEMNSHILLSPGRNTGSNFSFINLPLKKGVLEKTCSINLTDRYGNILNSAFVINSMHAGGSSANLGIFAFSGKKNISEKGLYKGSLSVDESRLSGEGIELFRCGNRITGLNMLGEMYGDSSFLRSYIKYTKNKKVLEHDFTTESISVTEPSGSNRLAGYRLMGKISLPEAIMQGEYILELFIVEGIPALFAMMDVNYPYTCENYTMANEAAFLGRFFDKAWIEVAPFQLKPHLSTQLERLTVLKSNFRGGTSSYNLASFAEADGINSNMDSFNNHITAGFTGVSDGHKGLVAAVNRTILTSMAYCPMRLTGGKNNARLSLNPFGTYYGKQRHHKTYAGGFAQKLAAAAGPGYKPLAPAFNGVRTSFLLALFPFMGSFPNDHTMRLIRSFTDDNGYIVYPNECIGGEASDFVSFYKNSGSISSGSCARNISLIQEVPAGLRLKAVYQSVKALFLRHF